MKSLSFRPVVAPHSSALRDSDSEDEDKSPPSRPTSRSRIKVNTPPLFTGATSQRLRTDTWLKKVNRWMRLAAPGESDEDLVLMFSTVLDGSAAKWFDNLEVQAAAEGRVLKLQEVFDAFIRKYFGGLSVKMAEQQLNSLVYGKGECKDLAATDSEFDRLAQQLYPGAEDSPAAISLLARIYSETIRKGDEELWEKAMDAQPSTVDQWKDAVQNAYVVVETKKAHRSRARVDRQEVRTTYFSRSSPSTSSSSSPAVQVKRVGVEEDIDDTPGEEGEEEVQKAEVSSASSPPPRSTHERLGSHMPFKHRERLMALNKWWNCIKVGHRAFDCPNKGKPGYPRKPTAEDLKA